ncbi:MAG: hypothetical protein U9N78_05790, partial [Actinomycetota bacterium]|nr:hypothetical protein [Actinomycetota bacterium]
DFAILGGDEDRLTEEIGQGHRTDMGLADAIALTTSAIQDATENEIPRGDWEAGILDRSLGRRKFRRLGIDEVAPPA